MKKLLILGQGRHGKDTVAEIFETFGYTHKSSSRAACDIFIYETLKDRYSSKEECFLDRNSNDDNRKLWYDLICGYNTPNKARLAKEMLEDVDIYVGMRDLEELRACKEQNLFDLIIWVDASERVEYKESSSSMNIPKEEANILIENNGTLEDLKLKVERLITLL